MITDISANEITALVKQDFDIAQQDEPMTEQALLDMLTKEVGLMIETRIDFLLGLMYRLDIDEYKIQKALSPQAQEQPRVALARLVLERQKQRVWSKKTFKPAKIEDWDDF
jgi:hypothetical protein